MRARAIFALLAFSPVIHAASLSAGAAAAMIDASDRLAVTLIIDNPGTDAASGVRVTAVSLEGAKLTVGIPIAVGTIVPGGHGKLNVAFTGQDFAPGKTYPVKIAGSYIVSGRTIPFAFEYAAQLPPASSGSSISSSAPNTTSGAPYPHEPPNFDKANSGHAWVVPTGPAREAPGSPSSSVSVVGGLTPVRVNQLWGYADASGALRIPAKFDDAKPFSHGVAEVRAGKKVRYIDESGNYVKGPAK